MPYMRGCIVEEKRSENFICVRCDDYISWLEAQSKIDNDREYAEHVEQARVESEQAWVNAEKRA